MNKRFCWTAIQHVILVCMVDWLVYIPRVKKAAVQCMDSVVKKKKVVNILKIPLI